MSEREPLGPPPGPTPPGPTPPLGPPPIEPLSDAAWLRVERGLWARLDGAAPARRAVASRRGRWIWIAAPLATAAAVLALVAGLGGRGGPPPAERSPARVVSREAPTSIAFDDVQVELEPHSAVVMDPSPSALIERGAATFAVAPRDGRPPFVVRAGDSLVRVIGTRFRVARAEDHATVDVEEGVVEVQLRGARYRVQRGERWSSREPGRVAPIATAAATQATATQATAPQATATQATATQATATQATATQATAPHAPAAPPPAATAEPGSAGKPHPPNPAHPAPPPESELARFRRYQQLERSAPERALAGYLALARGNGEWAANALYAAALLSSLRDPPTARALADQYLSRFPRGANVEDTRRLLDQLPGARR